MNDELKRWENTDEQEYKRIKFALAMHQYKLTYQIPLSPGEYKIGKPLQPISKNRRTVYRIDWINDGKDFTFEP